MASRGFFAISISVAIAQLDRHLASGYVGWGGQAHPVRIWMALGLPTLASKARTALSPEAQNKKACFDTRVYSEEIPSPKNEALGDHAPWNQPIQSNHAMPVSTAEDLHSRYTALVRAGNEFRRPLLV